MTRTWITPQILYLDRAAWGASLQHPRLGYPVNTSRRTEAIHHHSVAVDSDATPNLWESEAEILPKIRQLQTIRPDLGLDVPYNFVTFLMAGNTSRGKYIIVCEGRGDGLTGAHTHGHNTAGIANCLEGNFELPVDVSAYVPLLSHFWGWLKEDRQLANLGAVHPTGRAVYGHQDFAQTACPGQYLMAVIRDIKIEKEDDVDQEARDMIKALKTQHKKDMEALEARFEAQGPGHAFQNALIAGAYGGIGWNSESLRILEERIKEVE